MYGIFEDEDDIFMGSPKSKFLEIVYNANRNIAEAELLQLVERIAALELLLEERGMDADELEKVLKTLMFEKAAEIDAATKNIYMDCVGKILSQSE